MFGSGECPRAEGQTAGASAQREPPDKHRCPPPEKPGLPCLGGACFPVGLCPASPLQGHPACMFLTRSWEQQALCPPSFPGCADMAFCLVESMLTHLSWLLAAGLCRMPHRPPHPVENEDIPVCDHSTRHNTIRVTGEAQCCSLITKEAAVYSLIIFCKHSLFSNYQCNASLYNKKCSQYQSV